MEDGLSKVWSTLIQRPATLYQTRAIRFRDESREAFLKALDFRDGTSILEVGCGPGAFCHALERWLPNSRITGVDRDSVFVAYAAEKSRELNSKCSFVAGDALNLGFPDNSFDATTSHTVVEHVETRRFLAEQHRVLKAGGLCTVLSVRSGLPARQDPWTKGSEEEKALWGRVESYFRASDQKHGVARYSISETDLARQMMEVGFHDIQNSFLAQANIPDNADVRPELAKAIINAERQVALDAIVIAQAAAPGILSDTEIALLQRLANFRFDERLRQHESGQKVWDISASVIMVTRGVK